MQTSGSEEGSKNPKIVHTYMAANSSVKSIFFAKTGMNGAQTVADLSQINIGQTFVRAVGTGQTVHNSQRTMQLYGHGCLNFSGQKLSA